MPTARSPKPLIAVKDRNVAGSVMESSDFVNTGMDKTYIGGYSDVRRDIDRTMARNQEPTKELAHRLQWVRTKRVTGQPDSTKPIEWKSKGYRPVQADELANLGYSPLAYERTAEGGVRNGDGELYICNAAQAEHNEAQARRAVEVRTAGDTSSAELRRARAETGSRGDDLTSLEQSVEVTRT